MSGVQTAEERSLAVTDSGDPADTVLYAAYRLPIAVVADGDVIGLKVSGRFGDAAVEVRVPVRQDDDPELDTDDLTVTMAQNHDEPVPPDTGQVLCDWDDTGRTDTPAPVEVRRLLLRVTGAAGPLGPPRTGVGSSLAARLSDELFRTANGWHDVFRSWIEVVTLQDLDHVHPRWTAHVEGAGLATFAPDGSRLGHGGIMRLDTHWPTPATTALVNNAIAAASDGRYPPLAHQLLRDARAAYYREQPRKAILDAATATEISLTAIADRAGLTPAGKFLMLGQLLSKLDANGNLGPGVAQQLTDLVVQPRNKAVHEGVVPNSWESAEACKAAQRAVWAAFPI
jgi:hypothetical protein